MGYESSNFPRILALLRKERGTSQKDTAAELGISQALLSHYEKGIRRPGLDFLVRCADYYDVSCDYLLGRSPDRQGYTLTVEDIPSPEEGSKGNKGVASVLTGLNRKLIANSQNILFDLLTKLENKSLTSEVSAYLMLAVYRMFRVVYSTNPKNKDEMFQLPENVYQQYADSAMQITQANASSIAQGEPIGSFEKVANPEKLNINNEVLQDEYPLFVSSLLNLVQTAENRIDFRPERKKK